MSGAAKLLTDRQATKRQVANLEKGSVKKGFVQKTGKVFYRLDIQMLCSRHFNFGAQIALCVYDCGIFVNLLAL